MRRQPRVGYNKAQLNRVLASQQGWQAPPHTYLLPPTPHPQPLQVNRADKPPPHFYLPLPTPLQVNGTGKPPNTHTFYLPPHPPASQWGWQALASHLLHFHYFGVECALKSQKDSKRHSKRGWALRQLHPAEKTSS